MATPVIMPRQGQSVESCVIVKWHKKPGDSVSAGEVLFSYETDKAAFEEEAKTDGVLLAVLFEEGDDVPCLTNVCVIGAAGEDISEFSSGGEAAPAETAEKNIPAATPVQEAPVVQAAQSVSNTVSEGERLKISPRASNLAEKTGADIASAIPSGPNNRIIERDIRQVIEQGKFTTSAAKAEYVPGVSGTGIGGRITTGDLRNAPVAAPASAPQNDFEAVPLTGVRKVIAKTMQASLMNSAQLTLNTSFNATDIFSFRARLKGMGEKAPAIGLTDIMVYAVSRVLLNHKSLNAHLENDTLKKFNSVHMGIAVDTPRGLLVPTLFNASALPLAETASSAKELYAMCRQGQISPDLLKGATFTISNLGAFGIETFTPVLNPPQTGLLGICSVVERTKNGNTYPAMGLSLTFDHRALDGADAARFLVEIVEYLENFSIYAALS